MFIIFVFQSDLYACTRILNYQSTCCLFKSFATVRCRDNDMGSDHSLGEEWLILLVDY
jgi:hypothetical protein